MMQCDFGDEKWNCRADERSVIRRKNITFGELLIPNHFSQYCILNKGFEDFRVQFRPHLPTL